jgi:PQQ-dependent catabolism-associated beta-propeller protein
MTMKKPSLVFAIFFAASLSGAASAQSIALVSSEKDNALTVVNLKDLTVQGTISTCKRPRHMQLTPDRKQVLVACGGDNAADVIDLATRKSVGRIPLGDDPEAFDLSPDGKTLYVSNEDEGELTIVDMVSKKVVGEIKVGKEPEGVRVSQDGKTVYVTSEVASMVHVIDTATRKIVKNIQVGKRPRRMALTPDGTELWVTNELEASVSIISTKDMKVIGVVKLAVKGARDSDITPVGITMSRDGKRAFVGMGRVNHVAFIDVAKREVVQQILAGKRAWNVALNKEETQLYVANGLSDDMTVIDVAAGKALKTIPVGRVPYAVLVVD